MPAPNRLARKQVDRDNPTLHEAFDTMFDAIRETLKTERPAGRRESPLITHVMLAPRDRRVASIIQQDIHACLNPIWRTEHPRAARCI